MRFPSWLTWYKKPEYRDIKEYSRTVGTGKRPPSPDGRGKTSIPSRLRLDRVLENKTCSPMSLHDFYMYLQHIEFSSENLEFYMWFRNYEKAYDKVGSLHSYSEKDNHSFNSGSNGSDTQLDENSAPIDGADNSVDPEAAKVATMARIGQLITVDALCATGTCKIPPPKGTTPSTTNLLNVTSGPRAELNAVVDMFLRAGSEKELNIPPAMRDQALLELQTSSDPIHLRPIADHVYLLLRNCSHRNFVRLGVSNGTYETVCVATSLGIVLTIAGFLCALLLVFTPRMGMAAHSRWDIFGCWPLWWLGISLICSGLRGSCFFLLLFTRRQPLPWERFEDNASIRSNRPAILKRISRLMIFDRKFKVKDVHLRRLQHKIVIQSLVSGAVFASLGVLIFIFLPVWSETM